MNEAEENEHGTDRLLQSLLEPTPVIAAEDRTRRDVCLACLSEGKVRTNSDRKEGRDA